MNIDKFNLYYNFLIEENEKYNLTGITDRDEVFIKHFEDSLQLSRAIPDLNDKEYSIIDVGSGAGFPGLPLAIEFPNLKVCLTDALRKRTVFLEKLVSLLQLNNVSVLWGRAEDLARNDLYRERFDVSTARAVANLSTLAELCSPFVHKDGRFIPYKSRDVDEELKNAKNAIGQLGLKYVDSCDYSLSNNMGERKLLIFNKISTTPKQFPRKAGTPSRKPL